MSQTSSTSLSLTIANKLFDFDVLGMVAVVFLAVFGEQTMLPLIQVLSSLGQAAQALFFIGFSTYVATIGAVAHASITVKTPAGTISAQPGTQPTQ